MRFIVLVLCLATLVLYGRAIAGLWAYFIGSGRPDMIATGLASGTATALAAILLWKKHMKHIFGEHPPGESER